MKKVTLTILLIATLILTCFALTSCGKEYSVTWQNWDGTVLEVDNVKEEMTPTYDGVTPTKEGNDQYAYEFSGWDKEISAATGDTVYVAQFNEILLSYPIVWQNWDGTILQQSNENYGVTPSYNGETPFRESTAEHTYTFSGWTPTVNTVTSNTTYVAQFTAEARKYNVTWQNWDGSVLKVDEFAYGEYPAYHGDTPTKEGDAENSYYFYCWSPSFDTVRENVTYTAEFRSYKNTYYVTWENWDGATLAQSEYEYGAIPEYPDYLEEPIRYSDEQYIYTFAGWSPTIDVVTGHITYVAQYTTELCKYTVTWKNWDGTTLETDQNVEYGTIPTYDGETPVRASSDSTVYIFGGWSPSIDVVTGDVTYYAQFGSETAKYTVTWQNWDGTVLEIDEDVPYGTIPVYDGDSPTKADDVEYTYTFLSWYPYVGHLRGDTTYVAMFTSEPKKYTVIWQNWDGTILKLDENIEYSKVPDYDGTTPAKEGNAQYTYTFTGWTSSVDAVACNITYVAQFTSGVNKYTVTWQNWDGSTLKVEDVEYGTVPSYNGETPTRVRDNQYTYTFIGWQPTVESVTGNKTYTACYQETVRTVFYITFNSNGGQGIVATQPIYVGSTVTLSIDIPTYANHRFSGWNNMYEDKVYQPGDTFSLATDIELWAMWEEISYCNHCEHTGKVTVTSTCPFCNHGTKCGMCGSGGGVTIINGYDWVCDFCLSRTRVTCTSCNGDYKKQTTYDCSSCQGKGYNPVVGAPVEENTTQTTIELKPLSGYEYSMDGINWQASPIFENLTPNTSYTFYQRKAKTDTQPFGVTSMGGVVTTYDYYTVTYHLQDGETHDNPSKYVDGSPIVLNSANRIGYTFLGWYDSNGNLVEVLGNGISGDIALYARWNDGNVYTVELDPNGASLADCWMEFQYGHEYSLPILTIENYAFLGWYNDDEPIASNGIWSYTTDKLVAKWTIAYEIVDGVLKRAHSNATSIVIPDGVTSIAHSAFSSCHSLTSVTIPDTVTTINPSAFWCCTSLSRIVIPDSVTSLGYMAFYNCTSLTSVVIGDGVTSIGDDAFYECPIEQVTLPAFATVHIPKSKLTSVVITSGDTIPNEAFEYCANVKSITLPDSVTAIGDYAFFGCNGLTTFTIPHNVTTIGKYAFAYCTGLTSIELPCVLTTIGDYALKDCSGITNIVIPENVTSIGDFAFYNCPQLASITIEGVSQIGESAFEKNAFYNNEDNWHNGVLYIGNHLIEAKTTIVECLIKEGTTSIASNAFSGCSSLTSLIIPETLTLISENAFSDCTSLARITISDGIKNIPINAFINCPIEHATIPASALYCIPQGNLTTVAITSGDAIPNDAFKYCGSLVSVSLADGITSIGSSSFYHCGSLTSITIPQSVTSIGNSAFYSCVNLTSITIPQGVTSIESHSFHGCVSLKSITIPQSITSIGGYSFYGCYKLVEVINNSSHISVVKGQSSNGYVAYYAFSVFNPGDVIESSFLNDNGYIVYVDGQENILIGYSGAETDLVLPSYITKINNYSFYNCTNITSVVIGDNVTSIDNHAFSGCRALASVTIGNSVTSIGEYAFYNCSGLNGISIPQSVTTIGSGAFYGCSSLTSITIPNGVTHIGELAFCHCSKLANIKIEGEPQISKNAFDETAYHSNANNWQDNVLYIDHVLIEAKFTISKCTIKNGTTVIAKNAFDSCSYLTSVTIPNSITTIGDYAFYNCTSLKSIIIPDSVTSIGVSAFSNCVALTSVTLSNNLTLIDSFAFKDCTGLTTIIIPDGVSTIEWWAFEGCSNLTSIIIPQSVTSIGNYAFDGCDKLTTVYFTGTEEQWRNLTMGGNNECLINATITYNY